MSRARGFSIPAGDFARSDALLKRRRSPARQEDAPPSVAMRARSKSKSRARAMSVRPGQEVFALGTSRATSNTNKASYYRQSSATPAASTSYSSRSARPSSAAARPAAPSRGRSRSVDASSRRYESSRSSRHPSVGRAANYSHHATSSSSWRPSESSRERRPSPVSTRTRSKSATRERRREPSSRRRSPSADRQRSSRPRSNRSPSRSTRAAESSSSHSRKRERSKSKTRAKESLSISESSELDAQVKDTENRLAKRKTELQDLEDELDSLRDRVKKKRYDVMDLELALDGLKKRQELARSFRTGEHTRSRSKSHRARSSSSSSESSGSSRKTSSRTQAKSSSRPSKRPCIVDDEDDEEDDDVVIIEVKQEQAAQASRSSSTRASSKPTAVPIESPPRQTQVANNASTRSTKTSSSNANANTTTTTKANATANTNATASAIPSFNNTSLKEMPDNFWGRAKEGKLLVNHRFDSVLDGSARKGRHLSVNPMAQAYFATSADEGGLILWNYNHPRKEITKVVSLTPSSFRRDNPCAESIRWSPDGNRLAMAFRDPIDGTGEFCVVLLHELGLKDTNQPQDLPKSRLASMATTLHPKGISSIDWMPSGWGTQVTSTKLVTTGGSDHAVVLWDEHATGSRSNDIDFQFNVLHREHRSDIKALCIHSERNAIYTGGLDGLVIQYDLISQKTQLIMERRKPTISRINEVLEHPHNPHLLLISSLEQNDHNLLLRDLRDRAQRGTALAAMNMTMTGQSTSQYIVPRWSPAGMHVSCGSKTGTVNIWDVRMRGSLFPNVLPQQSLRIHQKTVLHATWHPQYDAMFTVSFDRTIGLSTFR